MPTTVLGLGPCPSDSSQSRDGWEQDALWDVRQPACLFLIIELKDNNRQRGAHRVSPTIRLLGGCLVCTLRRRGLMAPGE